MSFISTVVKKDYGPLLNKVFSNFWIMVLLFVPFLKPVSFEYLMMPFPFIDSLLTVAKVVVFLFLFVSYISKKEISPFIISVSIFVIIVLSSTLIQNGDIKKAIVFAINILGACMLSELAVTISFKTFLKALFYLLSVLVVLHLISQFVFPNGLALHYYYGYKIFFMDIDNQMAPLLFLEMFIIVLYSEFFFQRLTGTAIGMLIIVSAVILKSWSASALVGWFLFMLFLLIAYRRKLASVFQFRYLSLAYVVAFFLLVIIRIQNLFSFLIVDVLHKDLTFTHRTEMWDIAFSHIQNNWLLGEGVPREVGHIWFPYYNHYFPGHNIFIEIMLISGILGLGSFLLIMFFIGKKNGSVKKHPWASLTSMLLFCFFVVMLMEAYNTIPAFWIVLTIAYFLPNCIKQEKLFRQENPTFGERKGLSLKIYNSYCRLRRR